MMTQRQYNNGLRCRGICSICDEDINSCVQYLLDVKGSKYDIQPKKESITTSVVTLKSSDTIGSIMNFITLINKLDHYEALIENKLDENNFYVIHINRKE